MLATINPPRVRRAPPLYSERKAATPTPPAPRQRVQRPLAVALINRPRQRRTGSVAVSMVTHCVVLTTLVLTTGVRSEVRAVPVADTTLVFLPRLKPPEVAAPRMPVAAVSSGVAGGPGAGVLLVANPPPKGFQTVVAPSDIPTQIPPVDLTTRFDPRDYTGRGVEGGAAYGVVGGTGPVQPEVTAELGEQLYTAATTEQRYEAAEILAQPAPQYPLLLREAGISGTVVVRFIVDTTGAVEPPSIKILDTPHRGFEDPVRSVLLETRFSPARLGGRPVRQLTSQRIQFVLRAAPR